MSEQDGFDAVLTDKSRMSTRALIIGIYEIYSQTMGKENFFEVKEMIDELYYRLIVKPAIKKSDDEGAH